MSTSLPKIETKELFARLDDLLIEVLKSIRENEWNLLTFAGNWTVKDVAVHLLDGNLRPLSMLRDGYFGVSPGKINSYQDLLDYLNKLNNDWVNAMKRLSPKVLIELLEYSGNQYVDFIENLNPNEKAVFSVAWVGETESQNWFHIAREYTEKWHHQQQIRYALNCPEPLYATEFYIPYIETSMRALPFHYNKMEANASNSIEFEVIETGTWNLAYGKSGWEIVDYQIDNPTSKVIIPKKLAWKIFTKAAKPEEAFKQIEIEGDQNLGQHILKMLTVMA